MRGPAEEKIHLENTGAKRRVQPEEEIEPAT